MKRSTWRRSDGAMTYRAEEARAAKEARDREFLRRLEHCQCPRPLLASAYDDRMGCRLCCKLTHVPARLSVVEGADKSLMEAA